MNEPTKTKKEIYKELRDEKKARSLANNENLRREAAQRYNDYLGTFVRPDEKNMRIMLSYFSELRKLNNDIEAAEQLRKDFKILEERLAILEQNQQPIKRIV